MSFGSFTDPGSDDPDRTSRYLRFPAPLEAAFRSEYGEDGQRMRTELWLGLLIAIGTLLVLAWDPLTDTAADRGLPFWLLMTVGLAAPMMLRWLSSSLSPLRQWSATIYVTAVYLDVIVLMAIRVIGVREGDEVVPLIVPTAVLLTLITVQIPFVALVPTILVGLGLIYGLELAFVPVTNNVLFSLYAAAVINLSPLVLAYQLERARRDMWMQQRVLATLNRRDDLTGLPNRRVLLERLTETLGRCGSDVAIAVLDLDRFKAVNDAYGHRTGDDYLHLVGAHLAAAIDPTTEFVARLSGEEFVVLLASSTPPPTGATAWHDAALARLDVVRQSIAELSLAHPDGDRLTASAGCVVGTLAPAPAGLGGASRDPAALIRAADQALFHAKEAGRDQLRAASLASVADSPIDPRVAETPSIPAIPAWEAPAGISLDANPVRMRFAPPHEAQFRATFDHRGSQLRASLLLVIFTVCALQLMFSESVLRTPPDVRGVSAITMAGAMMPATAVGFLISVVPRTRRFSTAAFIGAIAISLTAMMIERIYLLPRGHESSTLLMLLAVLLSLTVVQIRFDVLLPTISVFTVALITAELIAFPATPGRLVALVFVVMMVAGALRFSYRIENLRRRDWANTQHLATIARTDPLTGLPNRGRCAEVLRDKLAAGSPFALILADIDHFKAYNDRYGHLTGDTCLHLVGIKLDAAAQPGGFVARLSGEEFAIILSGDDQAELLDLARAIHQSVERSAIPSGHAGSVVTVSAGLAFQAAGSRREVDAVEIGALFAKADRALYAAKDAGRNRLIVSS